MAPQDFDNSLCAQIPDSNQLVFCTCRQEFSVREKHTDLMYKSPEAVVLSSLFSLEDSSINLATNSPVVTLNTWVVLLQPVAMNLPSLENLTQQTTDEWSKSGPCRYPSLWRTLGCTTHSIRGAVS